MERHFTVLLAATLLAAAACKDPPEEKDKFDPDKDTDGDGLTDGDELEWGSDPRNPDSDDDGYLDGEEVDQGTHPVNFYSHPFTGGYNAGQCAESDYPEPDDPSDVENGIYAVGDAPRNFYLTDQHDEDVDLYAFCGQHIMLVFGAGWCRECEPLADVSQTLQDDYGPDGFQILWALIADRTSLPPETDDLEDWADKFHMETVPVLNDGEYDAWLDYELDDDLPTVVHIGPDMIILSVDEGIDDPRQWL